MPFPIEASNRYLSEHQAMDMLDSSKAWALQFYMLDESQKPITRMQPDIVPILPLGNPTQIWPVKYKARAPKRVEEPILGLNLHGAVPVLDRPEEEGDYDGDEDDEDSDVILEEEPPQDQDDGTLELDMLEAMILEQEGLDFVGELNPGSVPTSAAQSNEAAASVAPAESSPAARVVPDNLVPPVVEGRQPKRSRTAAVGLRVAALDCIDVANGRIAWYENKAAFEAKCTVPEHNVGGTCKLTRSGMLRKRSRDGVPLGGRPLGFLMAWLESAHECPDKQSHWLKSEWEARYTRERRSACRAELAASLDGQALLAHERERDNREEAEPATLDGLLA